MDEVANRQRGFKMDEPPPASITHRRKPAIAGGMQRYSHRKNTDMKVTRVISRDAKHLDLIGLPDRNASCVTVLSCHLPAFLCLLSSARYLFTTRAPSFSSAKNTVLGISKPAPSILTAAARRRAGFCPNHMGYFQQQKNEENFGLFEPNKWRSRV
jgi:hypothetical protein